MNCHLKNLCWPIAVVCAVSIIGLGGCEQTEPLPAQAAPTTKDTQPLEPPTFAAVADTEAIAAESETTSPIALAESGPPATITSTSTAIATPGVVEVANANVEAIDTVEVPGQEAGVIRELTVGEGDTVTEGGLLGKIDDELARFQLDGVKGELAASKEDAENDVNLKFAIESEKLAKLEYLKSVQINQSSAKAIPEIDIEKLRVTHVRSNLQVKQAERDMKKAGLTVSVIQSRVDAAEKSLANRRIFAPRTGVVVKVYKHEGEWVDPGDPVLRLVRSDRMRIEGYMNARDYDPHNVVGKPVRVTVELARGRKVTFDGVVKLPDLTIEADGKFRVWAEVENRKDGPAWLLRPGQRAAMSIRVE